VDAVVLMLPEGRRRVLALVSAGCCILYAVMLLKGAWDYWAPFAALQPTSGRWLPTGFETGVRDRAFYVTDQVPMLPFFRWLEDAINYGERYDKLPRVIPYAMLPFAAALMLLRIVQATIEIVRGERDGMIVSHEAEDAVAEVAARREGEA
jgi:C4-dicarboxylate transporter DctQ subunit